MAQLPIGRFACLPMIDWSSLQDMHTAKFSSVQLDTLLLAPQQKRSSSRSEEKIMWNGCWEFFTGLSVGSNDVDLQASVIVSSIYCLSLLRDIYSYTATDKNSRKVNLNHKPSNKPHGIIVVCMWALWGSTVFRDLFTIELGWGKERSH